MSEKKRFNLSFSMDNPLQREAWKIISEIPDRERTNAVCWAVCSAYGEQRLEERIREILREELNGLTIAASESESERTGTNNETRTLVMDDGIADFLSAL